MAAKADDEEIVELLLAKGARVDLCPEILGCSARQMSPKTAKMLAAHGANIDKDTLGYAAFWGNAELLEYLLDAVPPEVIAAVPKVVCVAVATDRRSLSVIQLLLNRGFDVNAADGEGNTALYYACQSRWPDPEIVKTLLAKGANLETRSSDSGLQQASIRMWYAKICLGRISRLANFSSQTFTSLQQVAQLASTHGGWGR